MTTPDWYQADDDDSDRARSNTAVWRDRGAIIAQQQARISELEASETFLLVAVNSLKAERDTAREECGQQRAFAKTFAWERDNFIRRALKAESELRGEAS